MSGPEKCESPVGVGLIAKHHGQNGSDSHPKCATGQAFVGGLTTSPEKRAALEAIRDSMPGDASEAQERRLLEALAAWAVDTFEASRYLDCYDPRARVMALRKKGHAIQTTWTRVPTESGRLHRIGLYTLQRGAGPAMA